MAPRGKAEIAALDEFDDLCSEDLLRVYYAKGMFCGEGCAPGFLYRVRPDGTGEEMVVDMREDSIYGFIR